MPRLFVYHEVTGHHTPPETEQRSLTRCPIETDTMMDGPSSSFLLVSSHQLRVYLIAKGLGKGGSRRELQGCAKINRRDLSATH